MDLKIGDVRPFVPAKDFRISRDFYLALGWKAEWSDENLALLANAGHRFYLQRYYVREWAENAMLHVTVADSRACHSRIAEVLATGRFPGARVAPPKQEPYGALVTYAWDPAGVLLHFAQWTA